MAFQFKFRKTPFVVKSAQVETGSATYSDFQTTDVWITIEKKDKESCLDSYTFAVHLQANKGESPLKYYGARVKREYNVSLYNLYNEDKFKNDLVEAFLKRLHKRLSNYEGFYSYGTEKCSLEILLKALESMGVKG